MRLKRLAVPRVVSLYRPSETLRPTRVRSRFALTLPRREDRKRQCGRPLSGYDLPRAALHADLLHHEAVRGGAACRPAGSGRRDRREELLALGQRSEERLLVHRDAVVVDAGLPRFEVLYGAPVDVFEPGSHTSGCSR